MIYMETMILPALLAAQKAILKAEEAQADAEESEREHQECIKKYRDRDVIEVEAHVITEPLLLRTTTGQQP